ncbi:MAG: FecR domain-containing protein [Candidatus Rokuibacteriota bacterium]
MIKIRWAAVLSGVVFLAGPSGEGAWAQPRELPARIVTVGGSAELHKKDAAAWAPAELRAELGEGDSVRTQLGGRITLKTGSGQALRLGSRSQMAFLASEASGGSAPTRVRLDNGWLWIAVTPNSPPPTQVEVRAGPGVVTVRGAGVGLRRGPDGSLFVQVHHGTAVCVGPDRQWERILTGPQELLIPPSGMPGAPGKLTVDQLEATWVRWNVDQDFAGGYGSKKPEP